MKIQFFSNGFEPTAELEKYARKKVARLSRRVPRGLRSRAACEVRFSQKRAKGNKFNSCTIQFRVDDAELTVEETTQHMYTSLDIAAVHMERQIIDFRAQKGKPSLRARLKRALRRHR